MRAGEAYVGERMALLSSSPSSSRMLPVCACSSGLRGNRTISRALEGKIWGMGGWRVVLVARAGTSSLLL